MNAATGRRTTSAFMAAPPSRPASRAARRLPGPPKARGRGDHLCAVQLDVGHEGLLAETTHAIFQIEAVRPKRRKGLNDRAGADPDRPRVGSWFPWSIASGCRTRP